MLGRGLIVGLVSESVVCVGSELAWELVSWSETGSGVLLVMLEGLMAG